MQRWHTEQWTESASPHPLFRRYYYILQPSLVQVTVLTQTRKRDFLCCCWKEYQCVLDDKSVAIENCYHARKMNIQTNFIQKVMLTKTPLFSFAALVLPQPGHTIGQKIFYRTTQETALWWDWGMMLIACFILGGLLPSIIPVLS